MIKKLILLLFVFTFAFRIWQSTGCKQFVQLNFDKQRITTAVEEQVLIDKYIPRQTARLFHNKLTTGFTEISKAYVSILNPKILLEILGPGGLALFLLSVLSVVKKPEIHKSVHFLTLLISIAASLFIKNSQFSYLLLSLGFYSFSLIGLNSIPPKKSFVVLGIALVLINLWYFAFSWQMQSLCTKIFFN